MAAGSTFSIFALVATGAALLSFGPACSAQAQPQTEIFSSQSQSQILKGGVQQGAPCTGSGSTTTQQPGVGGSPYCRCRDAECGGTDRRCYDEAYGSRSVVISETLMQQIYGATRGGAWIRCGTCGANAICWPRPFYASWVAQCVNAFSDGASCPAPPSEGTFFPPNSSGAPPPPQASATCTNPDWVREYKAQGASPPLRYQVGFNQGVARCLQNQCTVQNLAVAVWAAAFSRVRTVLGLTQAAIALSAVIHPPGFSPDPDPYVRGRQEGERLCNWALQLAFPAKARPSPIVGRNGRITIAPDFNARQAMSTIGDWLPQINPSGCDRNCAPAAVNAVRVLFGQPLEAAPETTRGWLNQEIEAAIGAKFSNAPVTDVGLYQTLDRMPDGTVTIVAATNPNYGGTTPRGPLRSWSDIPGHAFIAVKDGGSLEFWDAQTGKPTAALPGSWFYEYMIVGNPIQP